MYRRVSAWFARCCVCATTPPPSVIRVPAPKTSAPPPSRRLLFAAPGLVSSPAPQKGAGGSQKLRSPTTPLRNAGPSGSFAGKNYKGDPRQRRGPVPRASDKREDRPPRVGAGERGPAASTTPEGLLPPEGHSRKVPRVLRQQRVAEGRHAGGGLRARMGRPAKHGLPVRPETPEPVGRSAPRPQSAGPHADKTPSFPKERRS
jgi:hypothetical protein